MAVRKANGRRLKPRQTLLLAHDYKRKREKGKFFVREFVGKGGKRGAGMGGLGDEEEDGGKSGNWGELGELKRKNLRDGRGHGWKERNKLGVLCCEKKWAVDMIWYAFVGATELVTGTVPADAAGLAAGDGGVCRVGAGLFAAGELGVGCGLRPRGAGGAVGPPVESGGGG